MNGHEVERSLRSAACGELDQDEATQILGEIRRPKRCNFFIGWNSRFLDNGRPQAPTPFHLCFGVYDLVIYSGMGKRRTQDHEVSGDIREPIALFDAFARELSLLGFGQGRDARGLTKMAKKDFAGIARLKLGRQLVGMPDEVVFKHYREPGGRRLRCAFDDDFCKGPFGGFKIRCAQTFATCSSSSGVEPIAVQISSIALGRDPLTAEFEQGSGSWSRHLATSRTSRMYSRTALVSYQAVPRCPRTQRIFPDFRAARKPIRERQGQNLITCDSDRSEPASGIVEFANALVSGTDAANEDLLFGASTGSSIVPHSSALPL